MCYNLVKHIFNEATRKKISIFGGKSLMMNGMTKLIVRQEMVII